MSRLSRRLAPVRLAAARLRAHPGRWLPAALGVALVVTVAGTLAGFTTLTADRVARDRLADVRTPERQVTLAWSGGVPAAVDRRARQALRTMTDGATQTRAEALQPTRFGHLTVRLDGIAPLHRWARLSSGRLPAACTAARCEVLQLGGVRAPATIHDRGMTLVVVGRGHLTSPVPLGYVPLTATARSPADRRAPVLMTADPRALSALTQLRSVFRTQTWTAALSLGTLRAWDLDATLATLAHVSRDAQLTDPGLTVTAPVLPLADARDRAGAAPRRLRAIAFAAGGVLVALLLVLAGGLRAGLRAEQERLQQAGAVTRQRALFALTECGVPAVLGTVIGAAGAVAVVAALGGCALIDHALLSGAPSTKVFLTAAAATGLLLLGATASAATARRLTDLALVGATAAAAILLSDPGVRAGADDAAVLLPALLLVAGALAVARGSSAALRLLGRTLPGPARLALLDLARRPGPAALTVAGLAAAAAFGTFALALGATQRQAERDQAAFRVPPAAIVAADLQLRRPLQDTPLRTYAALPAATAVEPVLRRDGEVVIGPSRRDVTVLANDAPGLDRVTPAPAGPWLAPRTTLSLGVRTHGDAADLAVVLRDADETTHVVPLQPAAGRLTARTPAVPTVVVGLTLRKAQALAATDGHQATNDVEGNAVSGGRLTLGPLRTDGGATIDTSRWTAHGAATARDGPTITYRFDADALGVVRPAARVDRHPVPVLTDAHTAADAGRSRRFTLLTGGVEVPAVVVGTVDRVPSVASDDGVTADAATLRAALDAIQPGAGAVDELWVQAAPGTDPHALAAQLGHVGHSRVTTRAAVLHALQTDPLAHAVSRLLSTAAVLALVVALVALAAAVAAMRRDGAGAHADLEADGVTPHRLRRLLATQAGVVAAAGLAAGLALGLALTPVASAVLRAGDPRARPPLQVVVPAATLAVAVILAVATLAAVVLLGTRGAFRAAWPDRPTSVETG